MPPDLLLPASANPGSNCLSTHDEPAAPHFRGAATRFHQEVASAMVTSDENGTTGKAAAMRAPPVISRQEWEAARQQLLVKEKAHTRARDALAAERRRMPWMAVDKTYAFEGPAGRLSLPDL